VGAYSRRAKTIVIDQDVVKEDPRALAAVLAHELTHAAQPFDMDCVDREVEGHRISILVWGTFWKRRGPVRTALEQELAYETRIFEEEGEDGLYDLIVSEPALSSGVRALNRSARAARLPLPGRY